MKNPISVSINRVGEFTVLPEQFDDFQCGREGAQTYKYEVSIEATEECLQEPEMFLMDNLLVKEYFENRYERERGKCRSCEVMACEAIRHFMILLAEKEIRIKRIEVIIRGSEESFIKAIWERS